MVRGLGRGGPLVHGRRGPRLLIWRWIDDIRKPAPKTHEDDNFQIRIGKNMWTGKEGTPDVDTVIYCYTRISNTDSERKAKKNRGGTSLVAAVFRMREEDREK